jgi:DNA polymerase-3 subunit epsilon
MEFVAVDVETANQNTSSICQIGVATFSMGRLVNLWETLVNPEDSFAPFNSHLHGIRASDVLDSPTWFEIQAELERHLDQSTLASHTYFDRGAMNGANARYRLKPVHVETWIDTCHLARLAWPHLHNHKLPSLARTFGITYKAHNAAEDARCAGEILILAARTAGLTLDDLKNTGMSRVCDQPTAHPSEDQLAQESYFISGDQETRKRERHSYSAGIPGA